MANLGLAIWAQTKSYRDSSRIAGGGIVRISVKLHAFHAKWQQNEWQSETACRRQSCPCRAGPMKSLL